ncbi:MAG: NADH-quinone oxidoreductase subunit A [Syntrophothermus sp.]
MQMILLKEPVFFWPFFVYALVVMVIAGGMLGLSYILGERHNEKTTGLPYESGMPVTGNARLRFSSHFYLIAMFFVIFDLDAAFVVAYAVSFRQLGIPGYIGVIIFILILIAVLIYELRIGALDFGPNGKKILRKKPLVEKRNLVINDAKNNSGI